MSESQRHIAFCPHCGNTAPQRVVFRHLYESEWYDSDGKRTKDPGPQCEAIVCVCETCNQVLLYDGIEGYEIDAWPALQYPQGTELHESVPSSVGEVYREAARIKRIAPNAFAVTIRRALEVVCDDRGI